MKTTRVTFNEVSITGSKSGVCPKCGKRCSRSKKFYQTLSPFNLNKDKSIKSQPQILSELIDDRRAWMDLPVYHAKCE